MHAAKASSFERRENSAWVSLSNRTGRQLVGAASNYCIAEIICAKWTWVPADRKNLVKARDVDSVRIVRETGLGGTANKRAAARLAGRGRILSHAEMETQREPTTRAGTKPEIGIQNSCTSPYFGNPCPVRT